MLQSMTAFVRHAESLSWGNLEWEIRSLNFRYLEVEINVPNAYRHLEPLLREQVRGGLHRGKISCSLTVTYEDPLHGYRIDRHLLRQLLSALTELRGEAPDMNLGRASDLDLLRWPGVMIAGGAPGTLHDDSVKEVFSKAISDTVEKRGQEGRELESYLAHRFDEIQTSLDELQQSVKDNLGLRRAKFFQSLRELSGVVDVSSNRIEQEVAVLVSKYDISEEMERLTAQLADGRALMAQPGPHGRQLDFLMQEMNREANTIGAKVHQVEAGRIAIRLRTSIDQVREQVQNIE